MNFVKFIRTTFLQNIFGRLLLENGYEVKLPFKENHPLIHNNFQMCKEQLLNVHKKLKNDPKILSQYHEIFKEQKRLGIIEMVSEPEEKGKHTM